MKLKLRVITVVLSVLFAHNSASVGGVQKRSDRGTGKNSDAHLERSREAVAQAVVEYRESLERLLALLEMEEKDTIKLVNKRKELYEEGVISIRELEESKKRLSNTRARIVDARREIAETELYFKYYASQPNVHASKKPYTKEVLLKVLRLNALPIQEIIDAVKKRGVSFSTNLEVIDTFLLAGATPELIIEIAMNYREEK